MTFQHRFSLLIGAILCCAGTASAQTTAPTGACCNRDSAGAISCTVSSAQACFAAHGAFRGPNSSCAPTNPCLPPPPPTGACCTHDAAGVGSCAVSSLADCATAHGAWRGPNTTCGTNSCPSLPPPPTGACCTTDAAGAASCAVTTDRACDTAHGHWFGPGSACTSSGGCPTPPAHGACCVTEPRGNHVRCAVGTAAQCTAAQGTYQSDGSSCSPTTCPQPVLGACCVAATPTAGAHCGITAQAACTTGAWTAHATCRSANCPAACACDWDHSGTVDGNDLFAFFNDWHAGHADFNGDGHTDQQDLIDFAACIRNPPADCSGGGGIRVNADASSGKIGQTSTGTIAPVQIP